jgi:putative ABC transport system permease protein
VNGSWRTGLRLARRSPVRLVLIAALTGLPVSFAVGLDVVLRTVAPSPEAYARWHFGAADAHLEVLPSPSRRDPASVDVGRLLPPGTGVYPASATRRVSVPLVAGDAVVHADAELIETRSLQSRGMTVLREGRLPHAPDEVAVAPVVASRLGLGLGAGWSGASVRLPSGRALRVVGLAERPSCAGCATAFGVPGGLLAGAGRPEPAPLVSSGRSAAYFLDLPELSPPELRVLVDRLGAAGIELLPRDALDPASPAPVSLLVAGLIGCGLLAGTAFAVGVRRRVRDLALLAAVGATPRDLRRAVLAQGMLFAAVGSLGGIALGVAVPLLARPMLERVVGVELTAWTFAPFDFLLFAAAIAVTLTALGAARVPTPFRLWRRGLP